MSTFLENGNILLKCRKRFIIYSFEGHFISEASFNNDPLDEHSSEESCVSDLSEGEAMDIIYNKKEPFDLKRKP